MNPVISPHWKVRHTVKQCHPQWVSTGMNLRDRPEGLLMPLGESDAVEETAGEWGGQKCGVIKPPLNPLPAWASRNRTDSHNAPCHSARPEGSSRQLRNLGSGSDEVYSWEENFFPSSVSLLLLSGTGIPVLPVCLRCLPLLGVVILFLFRGKGHLDFDIWVRREMNHKQWP